MSGEGPIIVRRKRHDDEEEHHGGVWKLAFADFMTAMMAFFLVMWLINSTSKETKAVIVQYFNPIKLVESTNAHKGLHEPTSGAQGKSAITQISNENHQDTQSKGTDDLFADPMRKLDEIAAKENTADMLHDPFDRPAHKSRLNDDQEIEPNNDSASAAKKVSEKVKMTAQLQSEIDKITSRESRAPKVEVKKTDEGLLVSLTDDAKFAMFDVGSAQPKPQLVRIIGEIGKILSSRPGDIELRGYTDARVYSAKHYDNWRLSSDRANVVNYMLVRGGLPQARVGKISGFADRQLRDSKDPFSPMNRRIEILLRNPS